jgi:hypothetical protein
MVSLEHSVCLKLRELMQEVLLEFEQWPGQEWKVQRYLTGRPELASAGQLSVLHNQTLCRKMHTFCVMHTMKPFSSILYEATVFASCRILPGDGINQYHTLP